MAKTTKKATKKEETAAEKGGMKYAKITKWYERRVSLGGVSDKFDSIKSGGSVTAVISFEDQDEFDKKNDILGQKVLAEIERDLARAIGNIKDMVGDPSRRALAGIGRDFDYDEFLLDQVDGFDEIIAETEGVVTIPEDFTIECE